MTRAEREAMSSIKYNIKIRSEGVQDDSWFTENAFAMRCALPIANDFKDAVWLVKNLKFLC